MDFLFEASFQETKVFFAPQIVFELSGLPGPANAWSARSFRPLRLLLRKTLTRRRQLF